MGNPLPADKIAALMASKNRGGMVQQKRGLTKTVIHFAKLPKNHLVRYHDGPSLFCESSGCQCPTYFLYRRQPLCQLHLIHMLVHEVNLLSNHGQVVVTDG